jgi:hypothetical protein
MKRRRRSMAGYQYTAKILGDSPAWARKKRDCLRAWFAEHALPVRVTASGQNVVLRMTRGEARRVTEADMIRAERGCGV